MANTEVEIRTERIDELPVLIERLKQMKVAEIIDGQVGAHHLWEGLSKGLTSMVWLAHIMMSGDHRKVHVSRMLGACQESLGQILGTTIRESEFNDDRLGRVLWALGQDGVAEEIEREVNAQSIRYYRLQTSKTVIRIDTTSVSVHGGDDGSGMIGYGYSKDHRSDLMQFKVLMATLDPLALPLVTQMVAGGASDDGLYVPAFEAALPGEEHGHGCDGGGRQQNECAGHTCAHTTSWRTIHYPAIEGRESA